MPRALSRLDLARRQGRRAAQRQHARSQTSFERAVDVFGEIERAGIWLMFQRMGGLYGSYVILDDAYGVIINANHPVTLQRFTAAHEFGHFVLKHTVSIDRSEEIEGSSPHIAASEVAAQAFAAEFLIPLQLVNRVLKSMGFPIQRPRLTPLDVYRISLEVGASFTATVGQLVSLKKLPSATGKQMRKLRPVEIKQELIGQRPQDARADVYVIDDANAPSDIWIRMGDELHVRVTDTPSSGFRWHVDESQASLRGGIELVNETVRPQDTNGPRYGHSSRRALIFKAVSPGVAPIRLIKDRPWESAVPTSTIEVTAHVAPRPTGESDQGLSEAQKDLLPLVG